MLFIQYKASAWGMYGLALGMETTELEFEIEGFPRILQLFSSSLPIA